MIEVVCFAICLTAIYMQYAYFNHIERKLKIRETVRRNVVLEKELSQKIRFIEAAIKDFEETKKRIDALTLKAGFKL